MAGLASFATYAVGFFARPVGAFFFARIGDKHGRKTVLIITITLMGVATTLMGLLPTYAQIGVLAPVLLVLLRIAQGFGAGAELSGASVLLERVRRRPPPRHLRLARLPRHQLRHAAGFRHLAGRRVDARGDVPRLGLAHPIIASFVVALFAIYVRRTLSESPVFQAVAEESLPRRARGADLIRYGRRPFFIALALRIGENGPSYLLQSFLVGYVVTGLMMEPWVGSAAVMVASLIAYITIPISGWLSDRFGRRASTAG